VLLAIIAPVQAAPNAKPNIIIIYAMISAMATSAVTAPNDPLAAPRPHGCGGHALHGLSIRLVKSARQPRGVAHWQVSSAQWDGGTKRRVLFPNSAGGLPKTEITIATALKGAATPRGWSASGTSANRPEFLPPSHGFDSYFGLPYSNDMDRTGHFAEGREAVRASEEASISICRSCAARRETERAPDQSQLTKRYTAEAGKFIREHKAAPFFFYFAHTFRTCRSLRSSDFLGRSPRGNLWRCGRRNSTGASARSSRHCAREGLAENTFVFFSSDNGPWLSFFEQGGSGGTVA
jgi:hypothetical protein